MNEPNPAKDTRLDEVLNRLDTQFQNPDFTLDTWATQSNISVPYLSRLLREQTEKPASVHLSEKRLDHAKELLKASEDTIKDIANASGFEDNNYFSRKFKQSEGVSPTEWRDTYTKKGNLGADE